MCLIHFQYDAYELLLFIMFFFFFFQAEDGIRDHAQSRGLGDVYKRQIYQVRQLHQLAYPKFKQFLQEEIVLQTVLVQKPLAIPFIGISFLNQQNQLLFVTQIQMMFVMEHWLEQILRQVQMVLIAQIILNSDYSMEHHGHHGCHMCLMQQYHIQQIQQKLKQELGEEIVKQEQDVMQQIPFRFCGILLQVQWLQQYLKFLIQIMFVVEMQVHQFFNQVQVVQDVVIFMNTVRIMEVGMVLGCLMFQQPIFQQQVQHQFKLKHIEVIVLLRDVTIPQIPQLHGIYHLHLFLQVQLKIQIKHLFVRELMQVELSHPCTLR
eukprot:TRINITY_DN9910_c0_g1_i1.p2 TRINITY_DN9910_c0_g1~~TRINITY_DN9910_c0_g1_i1.p2  ORF type:complete len:319 (+),score=-10.17 TRINITY_DN9910_c0_g1_i1:1-957(+)